MTTPNTLGLDDDLDSVGLVLAIERAFAVNISDQEAGSVSTMGDLHDLLVSKLEGSGGKKCQTSMAFHQVRRALKAVLGDIDIRPKTALSAIWEKAPRLLYARAQPHCDLRLASLSSTGISGIGGLLIVAVIFGAPILLIANVNGWLILALAGALTIACFILMRLDPLAFGPRMVTVGDLARRTAIQNYGALVKLDGRSDAKAIWDALVEVAGADSECLSPLEIKRSTFILQSQFERAREPV